jgi:hypothetical protein
VRKVLFILVLILAPALFPRSALADINLCNSTGRTIWVAFGEQYSFSNQISGSDWISGWYQTDPGQCSTPERGDLCNWWAGEFNNCSWAVMYFAVDASGSQWGGQGAEVWENICTSYNAFFEYPQFDFVNGNCPADRTWFFWGAIPYDWPSAGMTISFQ